MDYAEKMQRYVEALEEERRKILVFQRELPLCVELVTQAIEAYRKELSGTTMEYNTQVQSEECSVQTSSEYGGPVLEEFIPIKTTTLTTTHYPSIHNNNDNGDEEEETPSSKRSKNSNAVNKKEKDKTKSEWLRSVQLWSQPSPPPPPPPPPPTKEVVPRKAAVTEVQRNGTGGHAFQPFQREKGPVGSNPAGNVYGSNHLSVVSKTEPSASVGLPASATSSSAETVGGGGEGGSRKEDQIKEGPRKQRRCWSPELHRRFLHALQQLGGSHVATPKQIRELMKVDGLTNDEVKSHLQKYRLHTRRPSPAIHNNGNPQTPQFVLVGSIWVPPPEYTAAAAATSASGETATVATANGIYAPVATAAVPTQPSAILQKTPVAHKPAQKQHLQVLSEERGSRSKGGPVQPNSPASSSSTHTTTTSPVY